MPGQNIFWLYVCTKKYHKSWEVTVKNNSFYESNSHRKINDKRSQKRENFCSLWLLWTKGKVMMFCQKEEIDHVLGNHKGARDHLVSTEWTPEKNVNRSSFLEWNNVLFSQETFVFGFLILLQYLTEYSHFICWVWKPSLSGSWETYLFWLQGELFTQSWGWAAITLQAEPFLTVQIKEALLAGWAAM